MEEGKKVVEAKKSYDLIMAEANMFAAGKELRYVRDNLVARERVLANNPLGVKNTKTINRDIKKLRKKYKLAMKAYDKAQSTAHLENLIHNELVVLKMKRCERKEEVKLCQDKIEEE